MEEEKYFQMTRLIYYEDEKLRSIMINRLARQLGVEISKGDFIDLVFLILQLN